jgi:hypothetical protein
MMTLLPNPKRLMLGYLLGAHTTGVAAGLPVVYPLAGSGAAITSNDTASPAEDLAIGALALTISLVLVAGRDPPLTRWRTRHRRRRNSQRARRSSWQRQTLAKNFGHERVLLLDRHPWQLPPSGGQVILQPRQLLLALE